MPKKVICLCRKTGTFFEIDIERIDDFQKKLNKCLRNWGVISLQEIYEVLNSDLPEEEKLTLSPYGWFTDYEDRDRHEFRFVPETTDNATIVWLDFLPAKGSDD